MLQEVLVQPLAQLWYDFLNFYPGLLAALLVILVGYFISLLVGFLIRFILRHLKLDERVRKARLVKKDSFDLSSFFGELFRWYTFIIFLQIAISLTNLGVLNNLFVSFIFWLPNLIAGILVILFGLGLSYYIELKMTEHTKMRGVKLLATVLRIIIMILMVIVALTQIGIETSILENTFLILIGGFALGIALALGLGFGLGFNGNILKWFNNFKKRQKQRL